MMAEDHFEEAKNKNRKKGIREVEEKRQTQEKIK